MATLLHKLSKRLRKAAVIWDNVRRMETHQKGALFKSSFRHAVGLNAREARALAAECREFVRHAGTAVELPQAICLGSHFSELDQSQIAICIDVSTGKYPIWAGLSIKLEDVSAVSLARLGTEGRNVFHELHGLPYLALWDQINHTGLSQELIEAWLRVADEPASWETLRAAMRGLAMARALQSLRLGGGNPPLESLLARLIRVHRDHVKRRVEWHMNHNHVLFELALVVIFSHVLGDPSATQEGLAFERELIRQTQPDGYHCELSSMYHFEMTLMAVIYAAHVGGSKEFQARLGLMVVHLESLLKIDPDLPVIGDAFRDNFLNITGAEVVQVAMWVAGIAGGDKVAPAARWIIQGASQHLRKFAVGSEQLAVRKEGDESTFVHTNPGMQDEGLTTSSIWLQQLENPAKFGGHNLFITADDLRVCFVCGPVAYLPKAGHAHPHMLQVLLTSGEDLILLDPGTYSYDNALKRKYFTSTRAHNTVEIAGTSQFDRDGRWNVSRLGSARIIAEDVRSDRVAWVGEFVNDYSGVGRVTHRRLVAAGNGNVVVVDSVRSAGRCSKQSRWQFGSGVRSLTRFGEGWRLQLQDRSLRMLIDGDCDETRVKPGWFSPDRGVIQRPPLIKVKSPKADRTLLRTALLAKDGPDGISEALNELATLELRTMVEQP